MAQKKFSHVDGTGKMHMVNVSRKRPTLRKAMATCVVRTRATMDDLALHANGVEPLHAARLAGIQAAKQTAHLIPLCHPLSLDEIRVDITPCESGFDVSSSVVTVHRTGVEMEALTACAMAGLSLVTSLLHVDPLAEIDDVVLQRKSGGKSGDWGRMVEGAN
jgi:cyclic pyranopterin monophosphate synthase